MTTNTATITHRGAARTNAETILARNLKAGLTTIRYGAGLFLTHIVVGAFQPVSLCGRSFNTNPDRKETGLLKATCPPCARTWKRHTLRAQCAENSVVEAQVAETADQLDDYVGSGDTSGAITLWDSLSAQPLLAEAVADRLNERGIEIVDIVALSGTPPLKPAF